MAKTAQQRKLGSCARSCKGNRRGAFKGCMRSCLGGKRRKRSKKR